MFHICNKAGMCVCISIHSSNMLHHGRSLNEMWLLSTSFGIVFSSYICIYIERERERERELTEFVSWCPSIFSDTQSTLRCSQSFFHL